MIDNSSIPFWFHFPLADFDFQSWVRHCMRATQDTDMSLANKVLPQIEEMEDKRCSPLDWPFIQFRFDHCRKLNPIDGLTIHKHDDIVRIGLTHGSESQYLDKDGGVSEDHIYPCLWVPREDTEGTIFEYLSHLTSLSSDQKIVQAGHVEVSSFDYKGNCVGDDEYTDDKYYSPPLRVRSSVMTQSFASCIRDRKIRKAFLFRSMGISEA
jgi:hypothetical protein